MRVVNAASKCLRSLLTFLLISSCCLFGQTTVNVTKPPFNAIGNGINNDGLAIQRALESGNSVYIPSGTYMINNSVGPLVINNFSATLQLSSAAEIVCNTSDRPCMIFEGGKSPTFLGLHVSYTTLPIDDCRSGNVAPCVTLLFDRQIGPVIQDTMVENAWAIGMSVNNTNNAVVTNTVIRNTTRDGLFLQDNQNITVRELTVSNSGDDCLGFHTTPVGDGRDGGSASRINCTAVRGGGIAFAGGTNLNVSEFVINGTSAQGIYLMSDASQGYLRPGNIMLSHGVIRNVGTVSDTIPRTGTQNGIQWWINGGQNIGPLQFSDIIIDSTNGYGVTGLNAQSATFTNVQVSNSGMDGATSNASCAQFITNGTIRLTKFSTLTCYRAGIMAISNRSVSITNATVTDAWRMGTRETGAKTFDLVLNDSISVTNAMVVDDANPPIGYTFNENANRSGSINGLYSRIPHGGLVVVHGSAGVTMQKDR
jgi:hypothetical protein